MNETEQGRTAKLNSIQATMQRLGWPPPTEQERKRFLERGTFGPDEATMARMPDDGKKPSDRK
jgi:hypothetical protein